MVGTSTFGLHSEVSLSETCISESGQSYTNITLLLLQVQVLDGSMLILLVAYLCKFRALNQVQDALVLPGPSPRTGGIMWQGTEYLHAALMLSTPQDLSLQQQ